MNKPTTPPFLPPPDHHWIPTEDGSWTIFSDRFQEAAHSTHGAIAETKLRFLKGCCIRKRWLADPSHDFSIFEVGYGLGIGAIETFHLWLLLDTQTPVNFVSCEIDENLILWTKNHLVEIYGDFYPPEVFELLHYLQRDASGLFYESHYRQQFKLKIFVNDILMHQDFVYNNFFYERT